MPTLLVQPCLDSPEMGEERRRELALSPDFAAALGASAVEIARRGSYVDPAGETVDLSDAIAAAREGKASIAPDDPLPAPPGDPFPETEVRVTNETTLGAARRLVDEGGEPLALNFANGVHPGGGFLHGALAQEEVLCRSSALYETLVGDPMYEAHARRPRADSTDWAILSPGVPVFRRDDGTEFDAPWWLAFLTCAAPVAPSVGQPEAGDLLERRIRRVLAIARAHGYAELVLGAWGCGAFGNDPVRTARDFRRALDGEFSGAFSRVVFAVVDWSPERRFLGPFRKAFGEGE